MLDKLKEHKEVIIITALAVATVLITAKVATRNGANYQHGYETAVRHTESLMDAAGVLDTVIDYQKTLVN